MNQILFTNNNNNDYNKVDTRKIIKIFCTLVIIIAFLILGIKLYGIYENKKIEAKAATPEIFINRVEGNAKAVTVAVSCSGGINYLVYTWNNEQEVRVNLNGSTTFERIIEMPDNAMNNLKVQVTPMKGKTIEKSEVFEKTTDNTKPVLDEITVIDKKLNLKVSDNCGISYIAYQWENEDEVIIESTDKTTEMTAEIDIARGTYKLQIRIVDINENEEIVSRLVTGVNAPEITAIKYGDTVKVSATHDMGFKQIEFIINDKTYVYNESFSKYDENKTTVEFDFPLKEGENIIQVNAYSLEKLSDENTENELDNYSFKRFTGKCTTQH